MRKIIASIVLTLFVMTLAYAQQVSPDIVKEQAFNKIKIATELLARANSLLVPNQSRENLVVASQLFVQAGQLFEQSGNMLRPLVPQYASQIDVENCEKATQTCVDSISNIKDILSRKPSKPVVAPRNQTLVAP